MKRRPACVKSRLWSHSIASSDARDFVSSAALRLPSASKSTVSTCSSSCSCWRRVKSL